MFFPFPWNNPSRLAELAEERRYRLTLERSLMGNIKYNEPGIFKCLRISEICDISDDEITSLKGTHKDDIKLVQQLSRLAESPGFMTERYIYHKGWENGSEELSLCEVEAGMDEPLMRLLRGVTESSNAGS